MEIKVGLIRNRHEMPVDEYIFDCIEDVHNYDSMRETINSFLLERVGLETGWGIGLNQWSEDTVTIVKGKNSLVVYVTGLTPVTAELVSACLRNGVSLTLMNYDSVNGTYVPQKM